MKEVSRLKEKKDYPNKLRLKTIPSLGSLAGGENTEVPRAPEGGVQPLSQAVPVGPRAYPYRFSLGLSPRLDRGVPQRIAKVLFGFNSLWLCECLVPQPTCCFSGLQSIQRKRS